jgi:SAM-dependent methyltransferase
VSTAPYHQCPVCDARAALFDVVDLNKSCEEFRQRYLPLAGVAVYYALCERCGFCFAPEMHAWSREEFSSKIYNAYYSKVDPDYLERRPRANADELIKLVGDDTGETIRHLDYGGGDGLLSDFLRDSGWRSSSFDPFVDSETDLPSLGKFDLVTAYEVFEHVPDVRRLVSDLATLTSERGLVLFSTVLSDGNIAPHERLNWWYASPRNGHISLFSRDSLYFLAQSEGFNFGSLSPNFHGFWKAVPDWACDFLRGD